MASVGSHAYISPMLFFELLNRRRVDFSQRRSGDGGACGRVVAARSPSGSGQPRSGRRPSGACTRVRSGKISVDRPDWDHAQRRALRGIFGGDARTAAGTMVCYRRLVTCDRGNRRRGISGRRNHLCVVDRRGTRAQADRVAGSGTGRGTPGSRHDAACEGRLPRGLAARRFRASGPANARLWQAGRAASHP